MVSKLKLVVIFVLFLPLVSADDSWFLNFIGLAEPQFGVSKTDTFNLVINTTNTSVLCKYSNSPDIMYDDIHSTSNFFIPSPDGKTHRINNFKDLQGTANLERKIYVRCKTDTGVTNDLYPAEITLMVDPTPPVILEAYADPDPAIEKVETILTIKTDDRSVCRLDKKESRFEYMYYYFKSADGLLHQAVLNQNTDPAISDMSNYSYYVACMNLALDTSGYRTISFSVDLSTPNKIVSTSPSGYVSGDNVTLSVVTNKRATCYHGSTALSQTDNLNHKLYLDKLEEGEHTYEIRCIFAFGGQDQLATINIKVDGEPPSKVSITTEDTQCGLDELHAKFKATDSGGIQKYVYSITDNLQETIIGNKSSGSNAREYDLPLKSSNTYYWKVYAIDNSGNIGEASVSNGTTVYALNHSLCNVNEPPQIFLDSKDSPYGKEITLTCTDDSLICRIKYCEASPASSCSYCVYQNYTKPFTIIAEKRICFMGTDSEGLSVESNEIVTPKCENSADGCCNSDVDSVCDPDCDPESLDSDCTSADEDADKDLLPDQWEKQYGLNSSDPFDAYLDPDNDTLTNSQEFTWNTKPNNPDSDNDGFSDGEEVKKGTSPTNKKEFPKDNEPETPKDIDTDGDGLFDSQEGHGNCRTNPKIKDANLDDDGDGLTNKEECESPWKPYTDKADSDNDGFSDKEEIDKGTSPIDPDDKPSSHLMNIILFIVGAICLGMGTYLFVAQPSKPIPTPPKKTAPAVTPKISTPAPKPVPKMETPKTMTKDELDHAIFEKRESLKKKKRQVLFNEFSERESIKPTTITRAKEEKQDSVFDRLTSIVQRTPFLKLDKITKDKDKNRLDTLSVKKKDKTLKEELEEI